MAAPDSTDSDDGEAEHANAEPFPRRLNGLEVAAGEGPQAQFEGQARAAAGIVLGVHAAPVRLRRLAYDRQPQAGVQVVCRVL